MANSIFLWPGTISAGGNLIVGGQILAANGSAAAPSIASETDPSRGIYFPAGQVGISLAGSLYYQFKINQFQLSTNAGTISFGANGDVVLARDAANLIALKNGTNAQGARVYGYESGSRSTYVALQSVTTAVTLSGATTGTGNVIPAGATVVDIATTTTTTITGASGYQVGDGSDADRYGDITGTAVGTASGSTNYTADPRWWATSARAVTLTAKTSNFTGGVVQVTVFYMAATAA